MVQLHHFLQKLNTELLLYGPEISLPSRFQIRENWKLMFIQDFPHKCLQQGYIIAKVGTTQMPNWRLINQTWSICNRTQFSHKRDEVLLIRILFAKWNQMDTKDNMISLCEMPRIGKFTETQSPGEEGMEVIVQWVQSFCLGMKRFWKWILVRVAQHGEMLKPTYVPSLKACTL